MHSLEWKKQARADLLAIVDHITQDNPDAAEKLADEIEAKAEQLKKHPNLFRAGRKRGTRELVAHPNYILIYRIVGKVVEVLRVKHAAQQGPSNKSGAYANR